MRRKHYRFTFGDTVRNSNTAYCFRGGDIEFANDLGDVTCKACITRLIDEAKRKVEEGQNVLAKLVRELIDKRSRSA